jgi:D-glycero-D-manno-heptose 1,7-bisphosphate phosphatase
VSIAAPDIRHVILDRDGVLNEEAPAGGFITGPGAWHWLPGSLQALTLLERSAIRVSVATNQSGVGRGLMTQRSLDEVHARMIREAEAAGGRIHAIFVCPHAPWAGCDCRKPAPGLIRSAITESRVPAAQTLAVGDDVRDVEAARAAGVAAALVLTGKGRAAVEAMPPGAIPAYADLLELVKAVLEERHAS